jgi:RNA ligase
MTTYIWELLDGLELHDMIAEGRINKQVHPTLPIAIFNYTAAAQFKNVWTKSERVCRGLIIEENSGIVIARGPEKFFNYGQTGAPEIDLDTTWVSVSTKEDGSLGIGWEYDGHYGVATRGSFTSDQAVYATERLLTGDDKASIDWAAERGLSRIWEIVYPENRIVLDYGDRRELIPLGTVNNDSGFIVYRPVSVVKDQVIHIKDALKLPIPDDEEGYVLDILNDQSMVTGHVKLKGEAYKLLHGLLTNTNGRRIWAQLAWRACHDKLDPEKPKTWASRLGNDPEDFKRIDVTKTIEETFLEKVPDEFYGWVTKQIDSIESNVYDLIGQGMVLANKLYGIEDKRERYEIVKGHPLQTEILRFAESGNPDGIHVLAWKLSKPGDETPFKSKKEED